MAFSMFAVAVVLPSITNALNGDVITLHYCRETGQRHRASSGATAGRGSA
jgi:hypothetical protein